jgi:cytochrome c oxidase assembly protein subunit 11
MTPQSRTGFMLGGVAALMLSLSFAAVPFYSWFCRVTGFGGTTGVAEQASDVVLNRTIQIRFDGSKDPALGWDFAPVESKMTLRIGETAMAFYEAYNPTDRVIAGQAAYNVAPDLAGGYFIKIACFCFTEQVLQPGERVLMPVSFYVDPSIMDDPETKDMAEITLSYTFFEIPLPEAQAALEAAPQPAVN